MTSLREILTNIVSGSFMSCGFDAKYGAVAESKRPDLGQFQCNGALAAAKAYKRNPRDIASEVVAKLADCAEIDKTSIAGPGFINIIFDDSFLTHHVTSLHNERLGVRKAEVPLSIVIDYGGANIAKPLHVGHLRPGFFGEVFKRLSRFFGHDVVGDVHLGDWGLQMGMVISEIGRTNPDLPYFDPAHAGVYPEESPVTAGELEEIYPAASTRCKSNEDDLEEARTITKRLQDGDPGYRALWQHIRDVSVADFRADYDTLGIEFDLWLGESDADERIPALIERLTENGTAVRSQGALVIFIDEPGDNREVPPMMLAKSDGAALYGTTDLATIEQRMEDINPNLILYVTDKRQSDHFLLVFRAARRSGIAPESTTALEHVGLGTMNGPGGKPFKTRDGGVMQLKELIQMLIDKALDRMEEAKVAAGYTDEERDQIARIVGIAALKYADLMNQPSKDYIFDIDRFASFEGKTGPYILYTAVRIKSILRNASERNLSVGPLISPASDIERSLLLKIASLNDQLKTAFEQRAPHYLCDYVYNLASDFAAFYRDHHILREEDPARQASWLELSGITLRAIEIVTGILGIELPERM